MTDINKMGKKRKIMLSSRRRVTRIKKTFGFVFQIFKALSYHKKTDIQNYFFFHSF